MSYDDQCEKCGKIFSGAFMQDYRHYTWSVCISCHEVIDKKEHDERVLSKEELE